MTIAELLPPPTPELPDDPSFEEQETAEANYLILTNPYERMHYVHLTDDLIARLDGSDKTYPKPDFVIYLDKSGRPVNWMVQSLWDMLAAKDEQGNTPQRPQSLFVNIDARRRKDESANAIADLRALFTVDEPHPSTETMNQETLLDNKTVMIVDEISVSGDTLRYANELLKRAYPTANFKNFAWMNGSPKTQGGPAINNPRWYERGSDRFRSVVENLSDDVAGQERTEMLRGQDERIRRGWDWLAKIPSAPSPSSRLLRNEVKQLAADVKAGRLPYWPSINRNDEEQRIEQFNHIDTVDFDSFRHWMKSRFWPNVAVAQTITDETGPLSDERAFQEANRLGNKDFGRFPLTEKAKEFMSRFAFTHESTAVSSLRKVIKQKHDVA